MRDPRRNPLRSDNAAHRPAFQRHVSVWIEVLLFDGDSPYPALFRRSSRDDFGTRTTAREFCARHHHGESWWHLL